MWYIDLMMNCPYCSHTKSKVTNKRSSPSGIRRRRECLNPRCKKRFTTYEVVEKSELYVVKKDGRREKFEIKKLENGIQRAFEKRPVSKEKIRKMISEIEEQLRKRGKKEIKSSNIGDLVSRKIRKLDKVAYIRFASVYKDFEDIKDFKEVMKEV
jgi:transcriptional repressor NrdR